MNDIYTGLIPLKLKIKIYNSIHSEVKIYLVCSVSKKPKF
jgi:hypothetical protein